LNEGAGGADDPEDRSPGVFEADLPIRTVNRWMLGLSSVPALIAIFLATLGYLSGTVTFTFPLFFMLLGLSGLSVSYVVKSRPAPASTRAWVRVDQEGLTVRGRLTPRSAIRGAHIVPTKEGDLFVRVARRRALPVDFGVSSREEGRRVLRALGFDPTQAVARVRGASRLAASWFVGSGLFLFALPLPFVAAAMLLESPLLFGLAAKIVMVGIPAFAIAMLIPSRIAVGADGVLVSWAGTKRFFPLAKIRAVEEWTSGLGNPHFVGARMTMTDGRSIWLPVGRKRWSDDEARGLVERIREAKEIHARGGVEAATAFLGQGGRDVRDWIASLRALGLGANDDLRTAALSADSLWRVVESHGAQPGERAAAAVALGATLDDGGKQRLRVAAEAVADERLRVAIDAALREDEPVLEEVLGELSARASMR
jgi:hypothetical protein